MKIELGTEQFRRAVAKATKTSDSGIIITTSIIGIEGKEGNVYLTTTDRSVNVKVTMPNVIPSDVSFYTNTNAELLKKLLDRTQSATVVLDIYDNRIVYSGSGDANLEIIYNNEDGGNQPVRVTDIEVTGEAQKVLISDLDKFNIYLKNTLSSNVSTPAYTNYRVYKNKALTYNQFALNLVEIGWDVDILLPRNIVDLFSILDGEYAEIVVSTDNKIKIVADDVEITGYLASGIEDYPVNRFVDLVYSEKLFGNVSVINKDRLLSGISRLDLFLSVEDDGVCKIEIDKDRVTLITFAGNCVESIPFESNNSDEKIEANMGLDILSNAISTIRTENIQISFGGTTASGGKAPSRIYDEKDKAYLVIPYAVGR